MRTKGFATGLLTGAVIGGALGMFIDPVKDKESKRIKKSAGDLIHSVGSVVEGISEKA